MSLYTSLLFVCGVALLCVVIQGQSQGPDAKCLGCICEGSTGCDVKQACVVPRAGTYFCGPFLLSYAYWADAGKAVLQNDDPERKGAFENCALDLQCASFTIRNYMAKYSQDCNGDGIVTCDDYMLIHKLGGNGCTQPLSPDNEYLQLYQSCASRVNIH